jgi:hypothetical protein
LKHPTPSLDHAVLCTNWLDQALRPTSQTIRHPLNDFLPSANGIDPDRIPIFGAYYVVWEHRLHFVPRDALRSLWLLACLHAAWHRNSRNGESHTIRSIGFWTKSQIPNAPCVLDANQRASPFQNLARLIIKLPSNNPHVPELWLRRTHAFSLPVCRLFGTCRLRPIGHIGKPFGMSRTPLSRHIITSIRCSI